MGNAPSSQKTNGSRLPGIIDTIATRYILTQDFKDMTKLENKEYCNKLIILTSKIISERLSDLEIEFLNQRTKAGNVIDEMTTDNVLFLKDTMLNKLDIQNPTKKKRVCIGISKFYIKIAHLFAAIVGTLNPVYSYKSSTGQTERVPFLKRTSIPTEMKSSVKVNKINLCSSRINAIIMQELKVIGSDDVEYALKPYICDLNTKKQLSEFGSAQQIVKSLADEPGIPELKNLYFDIFDYNTGKFVKMSDKSKEQYQKDLQLFYTTFTGQKTMPPEVKGFSDIKLKDYASNPACKRPDGIFRKSYRGSLKNKLFKQYAKQVQFMIETAQKNRDVLLSVLDKLFVYRIDPITKNKEISIHPKLNTKMLQSLVEQARNIIVKLYIGCENDFLSILESFEAIVEAQIKENTQLKITNIKEQEETKLVEV